jgi:hypothetical protein
VKVTVCLAICSQVAVDEGHLYMVEYAMNLLSDFLLNLVNGQPDRQGFKRRAHVREVIFYLHDGEGADIAAPIRPILDEAFTG